MTSPCWCFLVSLKAEAKAAQGESSSCELCCPLLRGWSLGEDDKWGQSSHARLLPLTTGLNWCQDPPVLQQLWKIKLLIEREKSNCWCQRIAASLFPPQQCRHLFLFYLECKGSTTAFSPSSLFSLQAAFPSPVKPQDIHSLLSGWTNQSKALTALSDIHLLPEMCAPFISSPPSQLRAIWWCVYLFFRFSGWTSSLDNVIG